MSVVGGVIAECHHDPNYIAEGRSKLQEGSNDNIMTIHNIIIAIKFLLINLLVAIRFTVFALYINLLVASLGAVQ